MYHISLIINISMIIDIRDMGGLESQIMLRIYILMYMKQIPSHASEASKLLRGVLLFFFYL